MHPTFHQFAHSLIANLCAPAKADELKQQSEMAAAAGIALEPLTLFVPTGADVSAVPADMMVNYLKVLKVEDGQVIWWKKILPAE